MLKLEDNLDQNFLYIRKPAGTKRSLIPLKKMTVTMTKLSHNDTQKIISSNSESCCNNKQIYEITYNLGKKWLVCHECLEIECFNSDIKEKMRISK